VQQDKILLDSERPEPPLRDRIERQKQADQVPVKTADRLNIADTLPLLLPEQQDEVHRAELRYAKPGGHGFMLTNGTGETSSSNAIANLVAFPASRGQHRVFLSAGMLASTARSSARAKSFMSSPCGCAT
jgi:hypothetical protein